MKQKPTISTKDRKDRRRFLRESLRGSVPLLLGISGEPSAGMADPGTDTPATSSPPEASGPESSAEKRQLDRRQEKFALDNPGTGDYPSFDW